MSATFNINRSSLHHCVPPYISQGMCMGSSHEALLFPAPDATCFQYAWSNHAKRSQNPCRSPHHLRFEWECGGERATKADGLLHAGAIRLRMMPGSLVRVWVGWVGGLKTQTVARALGRNARSLPPGRAHLPSLVDTRRPAFRPIAARPNPLPTNRTVCN